MRKLAVVYRRCKSPPRSGCELEHGGAPATRAASRARWTELVLVQDLPDGGRRNDDAETLQFAHDSLITPARVLACQPDDHRSDLTADRRPPCTSWVRPSFRRHEAPVPLQQSRRRNQKQRSPDAWQKSAGCRQEHAIAPPECRPLDLPAQHRQLMPEHDDFELSQLRGSEGKKDEFQDPLERDVTH